MKRFLMIVATLMAVALLVLALGCQSPAAKAQKMFNDGKYEELVAQYGNDPALSAIVTQAKMKIAEKLIAEGKYDEVIGRYGADPAMATMVTQAKEKLAEQLFLAKDYAGVIAKYPETTWAVRAKAELDKAASGGGGGGGGGGSTPGVSPSTEKAAQAELDRVLAIKVPALKKKALQEYVAKAEFQGTKAMAKAQQELGKM